MDDVTDPTPTLPSAEAGLLGAGVAVGGALDGRYEVRTRLGRGATKEVYLAYDARLDREVALAIVVGAANDEIARARVEREAQVTGRLGDHPNIITVYDTGDHNGVPYLVMRAMRGGSLADRLRRTPPDLDETIRLGREIALALAHAHAHGVVHRDVKPDNVWLADDGSAALGDFGIAQQAGAERLTAEGVVLGTVRYLSPEQIRGADVGAASDLYALGVTLYELVTGRAPFEGADPTNVLTQHLTAEPVPPSHLVPAVAGSLERLILDLLAKRPEERPPSAADVAGALAEMRVAPGIEPPPPAGAPPSPPTGRSARRLVSVLAAGADIDDPEALHAMFGRAGAIIERHGGTVERYLGDELVGFFGLTESHGDDPVRAARAAIELREATPSLRLGIESGELYFAVDPRGATIATGSAIKSAGRLADAADPGEIRLGDSVRLAFGREATVEMPRGRLVELNVDQPALLRVSPTPFVGRARELAILTAAFDAAVDYEASRLVTVVGAPGIGKSRLAGEFLTMLDDAATVLAGRCVAYGEGTTYRALSDIVRSLGGAQRVEELLVGDSQAVRGILGAIGLSDEPAQPEETALALRRLLERLACERPVVVAVEDIHWAQPALLDLLDHVITLSSVAPILLVCLTRPELLDTRPAWTAPQPNRSVVMLDALDEAEALRLAEGLGAGALAERIARRAEGNPLFVEQLVAVDAGQDTDELPVSIQAVLAARIDRLEPRERTLLQRASVEGRTFHAGALAASMPASERRDVGALLVALARKGLIGADRPEFAGEDAYRFTHALIREAAYAGLPKVQRAALHAELGDWLAQVSAADEIVGFHLEHAWRLRGELGHSGEAERTLAARAAARLEAASHAALARGDAVRASALLERTLTLAGSEAELRGALLPALGASLFEAGRLTDAMRVLDDAVLGAPTPRLEARARVEREFVRLEIEAGADTSKSQRIAEAALPLLEEDDDDQGLGRVWCLRAQVSWLSGQIRRADEAWCEAAACVRRAGAEREVFGILRWRATAAMLGPTPVDEAIARCEEFRELVSSSPIGEAWTFNALAVLHAMRGDFDRADRCIRDANAIFCMFGSLSSAVSHHASHVKLLAGRPAQAEELLRAGVQRLEPMGDSGLLATKIAMLAQAVYAQGRAEEASELCDTVAAMAPPDDVITQVIWRSVKAKALAHGNVFEEAETLARDAVTLIEPTDLLTHHGDAMLDLAEVLTTHGRTGEAGLALRKAVELYESKGNVAAVKAGRSRMRSTTWEQ